jgi:hypothetical protein
LVGPNAYEYYCTIKNNPEKREEIEKGIIFRLSNSICGEPLNNPDNLSIEQMVDNDLEHFQAMKSRYFFNRPDDVTKLLELMDITI